MKFNFRKTTFAAAFTAAALLGAATCASAASFVRVPIVQQAQISNGGTSPASDGSEGSGDSGVTASVAVGSGSILGVTGVSPVTIPVSITVGANGKITTAAQGAGSLGLTTMNDSATILSLAKHAATGPGGATLDYSVSVVGSNCNSCSGVFFVPAQSTSIKTPVAHEVDASLPAGIEATAGTYTGSITVSLVGAGGATINPGSVDVSATRTGGDNSADCNVVVNTADDNAVLYNAFSPATSVTIPLSVECQRTSGVTAVAHYAFGTPSVTVQDQTDTGNADVPAYSAAFSQASGTINVPTTGLGVANITLTLTLPAGQDVAAHTYQRNPISIDMTYSTDAQD